jgi:hypothetical protein
MKYNVCSFSSEAEFEKQANQGHEGGWAIHSWRAQMVMAPEEKVGQSVFAAHPELRFFVVFVQTNPEAAGAKVDERKPIGVR